MDLLVMPIQSISDVITNSSSELFVLNTEDSVERIEEVLANIAEGYQNPFRFNLKEYRKVENQEHEYGTYYEAIQGNFYDTNSLSSRTTHILYNIYWMCEDSEFVSNFEKFREKINVSDRWWDLTDAEFETIALYFSTQEVPEWALPKNKSLQWLDGKILILSEYDNSIPPDSMDLIESLFKAERYHLG